MPVLGQPAPDIFVLTNPLALKLPPLQARPQAAAVRHKRSIVVSMAEGTFCTGYAEIRLIQILDTGHVSWRLKVGSEKRRLEKPPRIITDCSFRSLVFS